MTTHQFDLTAPKLEMTVTQNEDSYAAFISHSGSLEIAEQISSKLSRVGLSPWQFSWSGLKVYFHRKQIRTGDDLPHSIAVAVQNSKYFVLLASKAAAQSKWVLKETEFWLAGRPAADILIVVLDGTIRWDQEQNDFDWSVTDCIPAILGGKYQEEVCWEDLRDLSPSVRAKDDKKKLRDAVASIGAKIKGVTKDSILSDWRRSRNRFLMIVGVFLTCLIMSTTFAAYYKYTAETPADKAYAEGRQTLATRKSWYEILLAIKSFERALRLNPKHVPALLAKADAHTLLIGYGGSTDPASDLAQAQQALNLAEQFGGDGTSEYHRIKGRLLLYKDRDVLGARAALSTAVEIDPNNIDARYSLAGTFTFMGQHKEAIEQSKRGLATVRENGHGESDNRYIHAKGQLAWTYYYSREYDLAIAEGLSVVNIDTNPHANRILAHSYLQIGNYQEAVKRYIKAGGDDLNREPNLYPSYTCARRLAGELSQSEAKSEIKRIRARVRYVSPYRMAQGYACLGETKEALEELQRGRDEHDLFVLWAAVDPLLSSLQGKAEFQAYLNGVGLDQEIVGHKVEAR